MTLNSGYALLGLFRTKFKGASLTIHAVQDFDLLFKEDSWRDCHGVYQLASTTQSEKAKLVRISKHSYFRSSDRQRGSEKGCLKYHRLTELSGQRALFLTSHFRCSCWKKVKI